MPNLKASVQYGDWEGTAAADNADGVSLANLLETRGLFDSDREFLVATELWVGENHGGKMTAPSITALVTTGDSYEAAAASLKQAGPPKLREIEVELSLEEFIALFKRFSVTLTRTGLALTDREYRKDD